MVAFSLTVLGWHLIRHIIHRPTWKVHWEKQQGWCNSLDTDLGRPVLTDKKHVASRTGLVLFDLEDSHCQSHGLGQNIKVFT
jgi:hypothetical protein